MQRLTSKGALHKDNRTTKLLSHTSKSKKDLKHCSSKAMKSQKIVSSKSPHPTEQQKYKQNTTPETTSQTREMDNDYGVNPYYSKYKVKSSTKKQMGDVMESSDYGTLNVTRDAMNVSHFNSEIKEKTRVEESDYSAAAFQKIKIPANKGLINADGKFVSNPKIKQQKNHSFHNNSSSRHSASLNFTSRDESKYRKKGKSKSKSKRKMLDEQRSVQYRLKCKSSERNLSREYHSYYYEKSRQHIKPTLDKKEKKAKTKQVLPIEKESVNSKATTVGTQLESYTALGLTQDSSLVEMIKQQITQEMRVSPINPKHKISEVAVKERARCLMLLSRICGALHAKRQSFYLAVHYLDKYISSFAYSSLKLIALGSLTLALKMDDAQMTSKFCYYYIYNPQKTVKKNSNQIKIKQKREGTAAKEDRNRFGAILGMRVSEGKGREEFSLEEVLDCQTQIMVKFGFRLFSKTVNYWIDMLTALWDSYVGECCPKYAEILTFRNDRAPRNFSSILQFFQLETISMGLSGSSKVSMVLGAIYLVSRMALQEKKEETSWQEICRFYKTSLAKSTNLIFCDSVGINILFGDFLTFLDLSMANIIQTVQLFSKHLHPSLLKQSEPRKIQGLNREDRLATHLYSEQLYKSSLL